MRRLDVRCHAFAIALLLGSAAGPGCASAQDLYGQAREISTAIVKVMVPVSMARHIAAQCDIAMPDGREARQAALGKWRAANRIETFQTAVDPYFGRIMGNGEAMRRLEDSTLAAARAMVEKTPVVCANLDGVLSGDTFAVAAQVEAAMVQVQRLGRLMGQGGASPSVPIASKLYTLAQLSVKLKTAMSAVAPAEAAKDRRTREARQNAAAAALEALGRFAVGGRMADGERFREWRGDLQSVFAARCRSFADTPTEDRVKALAGRYVVFTGDVSSVHDDGEGGAITFARCAIVDDASRLGTADLPEEGGLELRPPEPEEVYAGPGEGIAAESVAKVVYKAAFQPMMDGFGNGYIRREEDTYVLLKDGTAYRHRWGFPFTDVNVPLLKHRDPGGWYAWREDGGTLHLTAAAGARAGQIRSIEGHDTLVPVPAGTMWAREFYFLTIGMMGARGDRNYLFRADGTLDVKTSSFVAGQTAAGTGRNVWGPGFSYSGSGSQGFLMADGKSRERRLRYRIDGYTLELADEAGKAERHFVARFASDTAEPPKSLYLDGAVLWTRDETDRK